MATITLDPDFPGMVSQPCNLAFVLDSGETVEIEEGAVWEYGEAGGSTQIQLTDCDDSRLNGVCIEVDWSQVGDRKPETIEERLSWVLSEHEAIREEIIDLLGRKSVRTYRYRR